MNMRSPSQIPKVSERAQAQRERILAAAQKCFIEHGFHAASMSLIAQTAKMSPGLIYRYFDSKNAIILSIVERQLDDARAGIASLYGAPDFIEGIVEAFDLWRRADPRMMNPALFLEMSAEASRNPALAAALRACDVEIRNSIAVWLAASAENGGKDLPPPIAEVRALMLQVFFNGLAVRVLREPHLSPAELKALLADFATALFCQPG